MSRSQDDLRPDLHGLPMLAAWVEWVLVALVSLAIVFFSLPALFVQFTTHCREAAGVCLERGLLTPEYAQAFRGPGSLHAPTPSLWSSWTRSPGWCGSPLAR
jgi:hypothetical protein